MGLVRFLTMKTNTLLFLALLVFIPISAIGQPPYVRNILDTNAVTLGSGLSLSAGNVLSAASGPTTNAPPQTLALGGTGTTNIIIDWLALGPTNVVRATLTGNIAVVHTNVIDGKSITLETIQDATGNRTATTNPAYPPNTRFGIEITGYALTTNATYGDSFRFSGSGTNARVVGNLRGFAP